MGMEHYSHVKDLGGSSGAFLASDKAAPEKLVVIKPLQRGPKGLEELNTFLRVQHPHIIQYLESFTYDEDLFVVLRYEPGGDLQNFLEKLRKIGRMPTERTVVRWSQQLIEAAHYCHSRGVLHRDIKPENIFLSTDTKRAFLGDFGSSKSLVEGDGFASTFVGSPLWISPEVLEGRPYAYSTDMWSLGCVIYEMACLKKPFAGGNFAALVHDITEGRIAPIPSSVSPRLGELIRSLLQVDVKKRWTATEALEWLNAISPTTSSDPHSKTPSSLAQALKKGPQMARDEEKAPPKAEPTKAPPSEKTTNASASPVGGRGKLEPMDAVPLESTPPLKAPPAMYRRPASAVETTQIFAEPASGPVGSRSRRLEPLKAEGGESPISPVLETVRYKPILKRDPTSQQEALGPSPAVPRGRKDEPKNVNLSWEPEMQPSEWDSTWVRAKKDDLSSIERYLHQFREQDAAVLQHREEDLILGSPTSSLSESNPLALPRKKLSPIKKRKKDRAASPNIVQQLRKRRQKMEALGEDVRGYSVSGNSGDRFSRDGEVSKPTSYYEHTKKLKLLRQREKAAAQVKTPPPPQRKSTPLRAHHPHQVSNAKDLSSISVRDRTAEEREKEKAKEKREKDRAAMRRQINKDRQASHNANVDFEIVVPGQKR